MEESHESRYLFDELENSYIKNQNKEQFRQRMKFPLLISLGGLTTSLFVRLTSENFKNNHSYLGNIVDDYDQYLVGGSAAVGVAGVAVSVVFASHRAVQKLNEPICRTAQVETADAIPSRMHKVRNAGKRIMMSVVSTHAFMHQHREVAQDDQFSASVLPEENSDTLVKSRNLEEFYWIDHDDFDESYRYN